MIYNLNVQIGSGYDYNLTPDPDPTIHQDPTGSGSATLLAITNWRIELYHSDPGPNRALFKGFGSWILTPEQNDLSSE